MNTGREREPLISSGLPTQLVDVDAEETAEWRDSLDDVIDTQGSAELIWQGEIDVRKSSGEVVLNRVAAPGEICSGSAQQPLTARQPLAAQ